MSEFIWGVLPYVAFTFLIFGTIFRYSRDERGWTTKSSQFLSKKSLKVRYVLSLEDQMIQMDRHNLKLTKLI